MYDKNELEKKIDQFLVQIQTDKEQYFSLLLTMAKFHKYSIEQQIGLCLYAPKSFTACATEEQWKKFYGREILKTAIGIPILEDKPSVNDVRIVYDVADTFAEHNEEKSPDLLWRYSDKEHGKLINDLVNGDNDTPAKVILLCKHLAEKKNLPAYNLVATNTAYIVLNRLGYDPHLYMNKELEKVSLKNQNIVTVLKDSNELSKQLLNPIGIHIKNKRRELNEQHYENTLLRSLEQTFGEVYANRTAGDIPGNDAAGDASNISTTDGGGVQQEILDFSGSNDGIGKRYGRTESPKANGMGRESEQHPVESAGAIDGGNIPIEPGNVLIDEVNEKIETAIHGLSKHFGMDEGELRKFLSLQLNHSNINEYGYFDKLKNTVDKDKAKEYFEKIEGGEVKPFKVNIKIDHLLRSFIVDGKIPEFGEVSIQKTRIADDEMGEQKPVESAEVGPKGTLTVSSEHGKKVLKGGFKKQVFQKNVAAIRVLKQLEHEEREATEAERVVLQGYAGFGGLPDAFDESVSAWKDEYALLRELLTEEEYRAARASTLTAHFTLDVVIKSMYQGLSNIGFNKGVILEPGCGSGRFFANMPPEMSDGSQVYGVELDSLTGRIAQKVYPEHSISIQGFETTKFANESFDLAIGNVPFGEYKLNDPAYKNENFLIHDYFLAKMMDQVRPGGIVAAITSKGTMDKKDTKVREYLARRGELVKAIRLPNNAFKDAGTESNCGYFVF